MKRLPLNIFALVSIFALLSCNTNEETATIIQKFEKTKAIAQNRTIELFDVFKHDISKEEKESLEFLYAYMPLSDLADYDGDFYLKHVRATIKAKNTIDWANKIPADIFKHFVLPHRVNNENLDTARSVIFNALKDRIKGMSMIDAALEANHWCHERVEYRPADGRTSSPLATMKTAFGRCGEESTFTVAAMRAVCIPARQVYTPRWAHSDDNHAWVEIWADGQWYFLGACEPEPVLNLGWFNQPASRAMLVHARVYGEYEGDEEINISTSQYDDINVIDRYAKTFKQFIKISDTEGRAVTNAKVEYQLYNYAEFYPITTKLTDENGISYLTTGFGDLLIWAYNKENFGFQKVKIGEKDTVNIILASPKFENTYWELNPPPASDKLKVILTNEQKANNKMRLQYEDSIRNAYVSSFLSKEDFNVKDDELWNSIKNSRGNYKEIQHFIKDNLNNEWTKTLLDVIAAKDLRDTKAEILNDHLKNAALYASNYTPEIFSKYVLNPRIDLEILLAYRSFLVEKLNKEFNESNFEIEMLTTWIQENITLNNDAQAYALSISPIGVYNLRVADKLSRDIFFVASCRSFGIPARLEPGTKTPQYYSNNHWMDVFFDTKPKEYEKVKVRFNIAEKNLKFTPQYYHHFTLAKFDNKRFNTLELDEYGDIDKIEDLHLRKGMYRLICSNRLSSGKILVDMKFFTITRDTVIGLIFPKELQISTVLGKLNRHKLSDFLKIKDADAKALSQKSTIVIALIQPDKEPSKHVLNDIQKIKKNFDNFNSTLVFIIQQKDLPATFKVEDYPNLPKRTIFKITDKNPLDLFDIKRNLNIESLPKIMIANPKGEIIYHSEGYQIGIGNDILKLL